MANSSVARRPAEVFHELDVRPEPVWGERRNPLSTWTKLYAERRAAQDSSAPLARIGLWEIYARILDNPLLFPTFTDDRGGALVRTSRSGEDLLQRRRVHAVAIAERLRGRARGCRRSSPPSRAWRASAQICSRR